MTEEFFYNALNVFHGSNYNALRKSRACFATWEEAWNALNAREAHLPDPEKEWARAASLGIKLFLLGQPEYPAALEEIPHPPFGIYCLGDIPKTVDKTITLAIVGTRRATPEGKELAKSISRDLAARKIIIFSGLALGIDAAAHTGCIEAGGKTIAIVGNGLDTLYPRTNEKLAMKILETGGTIISEYPPGTPALPYRFLERNRIVSGLARGALVIEAPERSGSLATARFALEQNRDVFVVPGPVAHPNFKGSHQLIRAGAELVTCASDILHAFGMESEVENSGAKEFSNEEEKQIFECLRKSSEPFTIDKLAEMTNLDTTAVQRAVTFLIIKNYIKETDNGYTI